MLHDKLIEIKEYILEYNGYFNNAYSSVFIDQETGIVHNNEGPVFPNDTLGDYFYLRVGNTGSLQYAQLSNQTSGVLVGAPITIVACLKEGDRDVLLSNLIDTIRTYKPDNIRFTSFLYSSVDVVSQELTRITDKADIAAALQRIQSVIVSVSFVWTYDKPATKLNCLPDPCKICSAS